MKSDFYTALSGCVVDAMKGKYKPNCCLPCAKLVNLMLRSYSVPHQIVPCWLSVMNPKLANHFQKYGHDRPPPVGSFVMEIGSGDAPVTDDGWDCHLIVVAEERWVFDLSLPQADRPRYDVRMEPMCADCFPIDELAAFCRGEDAMCCLANESLLVYRPRPEMTDYLESAAWIGWQYGKILGEIADAMSDAGFKPTRKPDTIRLVSDLRV